MIYDPREVEITFEDGDFDGGDPSDIIWSEEEESPERPLEELVQIVDPACIV